MIGIAIGARLPAGWSLDFVIPLGFLAMVVPLVRERPAVAAVLGAGVTAIAAAGLPYKLGLVAAALAGITCGVLAESWMHRSSR